MKVKPIKKLKQKRAMNIRIQIILMFFFSLVLFINNMTDLFKNFGWYVPIQWITWIGIIVVWLYTMWYVWGKILE